MESLVVLGRGKEKRSEKSLVGMRRKNLVEVREHGKA